MPQDWPMFLSGAPPRPPSGRGLGLLPPGEMWLRLDDLTSVAALSPPERTHHPDGMSGQCFP